MKIRLLYFDGCPSWQSGLENLQAALKAENMQAEIELLEIKDDAQAAQLRFLGSPSFQVEGEDLWPEARERYALSCRVYATPEGMRGAPTVAMLRQKLIALKTN